MASQAKRGLEVSILGCERTCHDEKSLPATYLYILPTAIDVHVMFGLINSRRQESKRLVSCLQVIWLPILVSAGARLNDWYIILVAVVKRLRIVYCKQLAVEGWRYGSIDIESL
jgi:hypothetical protein